MSAPAVIDSLEFARSEQQLSGSVPVASLKRLEDVLFDAEGDLDYRLSGTRDKRNRPQLTLSVMGRLHLQCQRCLGLLDYPVEVASILMLVPSGAPLDEDLDDPEAPDFIEASAELEIAGLIEDEILLWLPLAPRHPEGACASRVGTRNEAVQSASAFEKLATLKRSLDKH
jgi:uncharacterized protein